MARDLIGTMIDPYTAATEGTRGLPLPAPDLPRLPIKAAITIPPNTTTGAPGYGDVVGVSAAITLPAQCVCPAAKKAGDPVAFQLVNQSMLNYEPAWAGQTPGVGGGIIRSNADPDGSPCCLNGLVWVTSATPSAEFPASGELVAVAEISHMNQLFTFDPLHFQSILALPGKQLHVGFYIPGGLPASAILEVNLAVVPVVISQAQQAEMMGAILAAAV